MSTPLGLSRRRRNLRGGLSSAAAALRLGPVIASIAPSSATPGSTLTITGTGFGATQGAGGVTVNSVPATIQGWGATTITATAPAQASYPNTGSVVVTANSGAAGASPTSFTTTSPYNLKAAGFDGGTSHNLLSSLSPSLRLANQSISLAAWVYLDPAWSVTGHVAGVMVLGTVSFALGVNAVRKPFFQMDAGGSGPTIATAASAIATGGWHLLAGVFNFTPYTVNLSVDDGAFVSANLGGALTMNNQAFTLGCSNNGSTWPFFGRIDEVAVWQNRALASGDVDLLWKAGTGLSYFDLTGSNAGLKTNLTAWWDLDEATGASRLDASGAGLTLTDNNTVTQVVGIR